MLIYEPDFAPLVDAPAAIVPAGTRAGSRPANRYEELLARGRLERPDPFSIDENAIAELFYTSGSTGTPKGVMLSHRTLYLHALSVRRQIRRQTNDRWSCTPSRCSTPTAGDARTPPP